MTGDRNGQNEHNEDNNNYTIWLDREEAIRLIKRCMNNNNEYFADLFKAAMEV